MIDIIRGVSIKVWPVIDETAAVHPDILEAMCKQMNNDTEPEDITEHLTSQDQDQ